MKRENDFRGLNPIHLGSLSQNLLGLGDPPLRQQPSRRLWDKPANNNRSLLYLFNAAKCN